MIRVELPYHLRNLAGIDREVTLDLQPPATLNAVLDALEVKHPAIAGTIRDHTTKQRRPLIRFYACQEDLSHEPPDAALPDAVAQGHEPLIIVGAISGG